MRIDLHTHSRASDGTDSPASWCTPPRAAGLDVLALTDHDTTDGWAEAADAAARGRARPWCAASRSAPGWRAGSGVHLLAYLPDPTYPPLVDELQRVLDGRDERVPAILERLREHGVDMTEEDVRRLAGGTAAIGRPHVADALVALGVVADRNEAFATGSGRGGPAYVAPLRRRRWSR